MTRSRTARLLVGCAVVGIAGAMPIAPAQARAPGDAAINVGIRPSDEAQWFHVNLIPGEKSDRAAVVSNLSSTAVDLQIYPAAAANTPQGGFALDSREQPPRQVGDWTRLKVKELHLPARSSTTVGFRVEVPLDATPGDYAGGIVIQRTARDASDNAGKDLALRVNVVQRVGVRIYVNVAGQAKPGLTVGGLTWRQNEQGGGTYSLPVTNTGNVRLKPSGQVRLTGFNLPSGAVGLSRVEELLPGSMVTVTGTMAERPFYGWGDAVATIDTAEGVRATAGTGLRFVPWLAALGALGTLVVLMFGAWRFVGFLRRARAALRQTQPTAA